MALGGRLPVPREGLLAMAERMPGLRIATGDDCQRQGDDLLVDDDSVASLRGMAWLRALSSMSTIFVRDAINSCKGSVVVIVMVQKIYCCYSMVLLRGCVG